MATLAAQSSSTSQAPDGRLARLRAPADLLTPLARRCGRLWRSPDGQPRWARPALLGVAALAALAYGWRANEIPVEPYYAAAARSMAESWHNFLYGAFDPAGTITTNKLPGALWLQALSLRIAGFHVWAMVVPQAIEGVVAVLVMYRLMRRLAGPVAGIAAAALLALNPATVALNRGNVSDSLLVMLSVLAADATVLALSRGRLRALLLAGVWVGLAFQAKMLQAWLILPGLAAAYLVAAPAPRMWTRLRHVALAGAVAVAVSLSWMSAVSLVPAAQRPYVDGSVNDSLFSQVFEYNGVSRLGSGRSPAGAGRAASFLTEEEAGESTAAAHTSAGWDRLLTGLYGLDIGWLLPAALIAASSILVARRGRDRRDRLRASVLLWGPWLVVLWVAFSAGIYLHPYYVAALAPPLAGLTGAGIGLAWTRRRRAAARLILAAALIASTAYGVYLLSAGVRVPGWLVPAGIGATAVAVLLLLARPRGDRRARVSPGAATAIAAVCLLLLPVAASVEIVSRGVGSFAVPFESAAATQSPAQAKLAFQQSVETVEALESRYATPIPFATDTAELAAPFIYATGKEILPIGGFEGGIPTPTLAQLRRYIATSRLRAIIVPLSTKDSRIAWVLAHCARTSTESHGAGRVVLYDCNLQG